MLIRTEKLIVDPRAFGIATATPAQRAACRVLDGVDLGDLQDDADAIALLGGAEARDAWLASLKAGMNRHERRAVDAVARKELRKLDKLAAFHGPTEVVFLASVRSAKTIIACAAAIRMSQTVDLSRLGHGETPRVSLVSLTMDNSDVAFSLLSETLRSSPLLSRLLVSINKRILLVRHPSGRLVEIAVVAGKAAGGGLVSRWSAGVIFDEAPRMNGSSDAVVNLDHARTAVLGRLLPGAQVLYIGSAWAPHGPVYEMVQEHWRKPSADMVVLRGTGPMLNPVWWTPERCESLQERDPVAYQTDVLGEFADPESGLLNPIAVRRSTREAPLELSPERGARYFAAIDASDGNSKGNASTVVILQRIDPPRERADMDRPLPRFRVAVAREFRGMRPEQFFREVAGICKAYSVRSAASDQYSGASNQDLARRHGLTLRVVPTTAANKLEDFTNLATVIHSDRIELPPDRQFRRDLLAVKRRTTQQGVSIVLPRTGDGRHCDFAPALASALREAGTTAPINMQAIVSHGGRWSREPGRGFG